MKDIGRFSVRNLGMKEIGRDSTGSQAANQDGGTTHSIMPFLTSLPPELLMSGFHRHLNQLPCKNQKAGGHPTNKNHQSSRRRQVKKSYWYLGRGWYCLREGPLFAYGSVG
ncbi:hypothetical protein LINPERPRIM_LOCUS5622 [Linum perenne]